MSTRAGLSAAAIAAFVTVVSPAVRAQMVATPVVIENPDESKTMSINVRGKPFRIWHLQSGGKWQMMSYVIETGRLRKLIVIDGGAALEARNLRRFIQLRNANGAFSVAAWFVTHQHVDHFGALNALIQTEVKTGQIGTVFGSFLPVSTIQAAGNEGAHVASAQALNDGMERVGIQHNVDLMPGNVIWIDGVKIEILGARNPEFAAQMDQNIVNDSSLVFRVSDGARSISVHRRSRPLRRPETAGGAISLAVAVGLRADGAPRLKRRNARVLPAGQCALLPVAHERSDLQQTRRSRSAR